MIGAVLAATIGLAADVGRFTLWAQIVYLGLFLLSPVAWTLVGLAIGAALRRAGVARISTPR